MTRTAQPQLKRKPAKPPAAATTVAQPATKPVTRVTMTPPRASAVTRQRARRKRQLARTVRRFEAVLTRLPSLALPTQIGGTFRPIGATVWRTSKLVSLILLVGVVAALGYLQSDLSWFVYRETVQIHGATYFSPDEIYQASDVDSWNIFWLQPQAVRERLLALPHIRGASVSVTLPNQVAITVQEEQPVALWVTNEATLWLMPDGAALSGQDGRFAALPQIVDPDREAQAVTQPDRLAMDPAVLAAALTLIKQVPGIPQVRFNRDYGLNFNLPNSSTWVYWGDGQNLETKFANLAAAQQLIAGGQVDPEIIDVRYERPYIR
jgi:cell division protein FtsQ